MTNEVAKREETGVVSARRQALINQGMQQSGERKKSMVCIPTIQLNNSPKMRREMGIPIGEFYLSKKTEKMLEVSSLGKEVHGVVLKIRYSVKSQYDPSGRDDYFFSKEFDNYNGDIEVLSLDANKKVKPYFSGTYKEWTEKNSTVNPRTGQKKNLFSTFVHLYVLIDGKIADPKVLRLSFTGKSMSNYFTYLSGDKARDIKGIHDLNVHLHTHIHNFVAGEYKTPEGKPYFAIDFSYGEELDDDTLEAVVAMQASLNAQLAALDNYGKEEKVAPMPEDSRISERAADAANEAAAMPTEAELSSGEVEEVRIEDVPF